MHVFIKCIIFNHYHWSMIVYISLLFQDYITLFYLLTICHIRTSPFVCWHEFLFKWKNKFSMKEVLVCEMSVAWNPVFTLLQILISYKAPALNWTAQADRAAYVGSIPTGNYLTKLTWDVKWGHKKWLMYDYVKPCWALWRIKWHTKWILYLHE
jgi:hypothetical protein